MTDAPAPPARNGNGKTIVLHLVSHASGEMVEMIARNAVAQLDEVTVERHLWKMVRSLSLLPDILAAIAGRRGFVFHSIAATDIRNALEEGCVHLGVPCEFVLEPFVSRLAEYSGATVRFHTGAREFLDEDYYQRVEAMKFTLAHDDGLASDDLDGADVILVGVSRATKTPTCMYLASRGVKAANVPLVPGLPLPEAVIRSKSLVVGLTVRPEVLATVRSSRLLGLSEDRPTAYAETESVTREVQEARRLCARHGWRVIDVTGRSIEHTSALILEMLRKRGGTAGARFGPPGEP